MDADQTKSSLACRVFMDLQNDEQVTNVEKCYDAELDVVYLRGTRNGASVTFVPILSCQDMDFEQVEKMQNKFGSNGEKKITIAICDTSATVLYYQLVAGFVEKD